MAGMAGIAQDDPASQWVLALSRDWMGLDVILGILIPHSRWRELRRRVCFPRFGLLGGGDTMNVNFMTKRI
jgi:hypothetical protein